MGLILSSSSSGSSCSDRYQWTQLRAEATLRADGIANEITIGVTQYISFSTLDINVIQISNNVAQGVGDGTATISIDNISPGVSISTTQITVQSSRAVIISLRAEVITSMTSSISTTTSIYPNPYETFEILSYGSQVLNQEGASGILVVYATFDNSDVPILLSSSEESFFYTNHLNQSLILDSTSSPPTVTVNTGATYACGNFLSVDWQASCGETIASTDVSLLLDMPDVSGITVSIATKNLMLPSGLASALGTLFFSLFLSSLSYSTQ